MSAAKPRDGLPIGQVLHGDCLRVLAGWPAGCVDAVVTDPPYGLHFMGAAWDRFERVKRATAQPDKGRNLGSAIAHEAGAYDTRRNAEYGRYMQRVARELLRVLKPGGHAAMFGAPRREHWQGMALELAGFEIRDKLMWLFGEGFPKALNLHGEWEGWGTALKPAWEPIILARKPLERGRTVAGNVLAHGTGALHIEACRVPGPKPDTIRGAGGQNGRFRPIAAQGLIEDDGLGRWPPNVALDEQAAALLDEQTGELGGRGNVAPSRSTGATLYGPADRPNDGYANDTGGASRFFYCAKARRGEREAGLEGFERGFLATMGGGIGAREHNVLEPSAHVRNDHPTVKPIDVMRWLVRMIAPPGGMVLDPFAGSGTTLCAAAIEGVAWVGIEQVERYCAIARARAAHWAAEAPGILAAETRERRQAELARAQGELLEAGA